VGDNRLPHESEEMEARRYRFQEKWGVGHYDDSHDLVCNDPDLSYEQIKQQLTGWRSVVQGQKLDDVAAVYEDIPVCFISLLSRLQGFSGPRDRIVQCKEEDEMFEALAANSPRWRQMTPDQWKEYLGNWAPPDMIHITYALNADPLTVQERVFHSQIVLRYMRYGPQHALTRRVFQVAQGIVGHTRDPQEGRRHDFAQDDLVWQVWDLKQQKMTDMEIARNIWPAEYKRGKGRDAKTGEKGRLAQRVHDYHQRAKNWIKEYPIRVRHSMQVL
jgi:hypothetical protein